MAVVLGAALAFASPAAAQTIYQFDSANTSAIPANAQAVAGYLNGAWPTFKTAVADYPKAAHLPITVYDVPVRGYPVVCIDLEPGNPPASVAGPWAKQELSFGVHPCIYSMLSWMSAVKSSLAAAGVSRAKVLLWDADWTFVAHIDAGYDGTQYTDHALNRNLDESEMSSAFYAAIDPKPAPKPAPKPKPKSKVARWTAARNSTLRALNADHCSHVVIFHGKTDAQFVSGAVCKTLRQRADWFEAKLRKAGH